MLPDFALDQFVLPVVLLSLWGRGLRCDEQPFLDIVVDQVDLDRLLRSQTHQRTSVHLYLLQDNRFIELS